MPVCVVLLLECGNCFDIPSEFVYLPEQLITVCVEHRTIKHELPNKRNMLG